MAESKAKSDTLRASLLRASSRQMAHLFTNHDPRRLHALAGASVLLHFVYRLLLLAWRGDAFPDDGRGSAATHLSVALHAVLHATSFVPHVPRRRATSKPMIWPEFRVHNAIFSLRHVACTLVAVNASRLHGYDFALRVGVAFVAMAMADVTTARIGDASHRTTNAMPYPVHSPERDVANTKRFWRGSSRTGCASSARCPSTRCGVSCSRCRTCTRCMGRPQWRRTTSAPLLCHTP